MRIRPARMCERELQRNVIRAAHLLGWLCAHFRPARTACGNWRTPVEADGAGFPDLVLVKGVGMEDGRVLFRELKSENGELSLAQLRWLAALTAAGADARTWTAEMWRDGRILEELKGG